MPTTSDEPRRARCATARPRRAARCLAALVVVLTVRDATAAVLCQNRRSGRLAVRAAACGRPETPLDLATVLLDGAVTPIKLSATARAAAGSVVLTGTTVATTPTTLDSFTVDVPGPGTLLVTVAGMLLIDADSAINQALTVPARLGLCDTPASDVQCGGTYSQVWYQDADDTDGFNATPAFTLVRTIGVGAAGARQFYVNGEAPPGGTSLTLWQDPIVGQGPVATAMFFPAALTVSKP